MTEEPDVERVQARASLLPEEIAAGGSADPEAQAAAILEDSDRRTEDPEQTKHESGQTPD
jgi:hypothetical protein